jgi:hypothetical protein
MSYLFSLVARDPAIFHKAFPILRALAVLSEEKFLVRAALQCPSQNIGLI